MKSLRKFMPFTLMVVANLVACSAYNTERIEKIEQPLTAFSTHQVFDTTSLLPANEQRGTDPFVRILDGNIYIGATSFPHDPLLTDGGSLWRSTNNGTTWSYLGTEGGLTQDHLATETAMDIDGLGHLWFAEQHVGYDPIYRYDNPATLINRSSNFSSANTNLSAGVDRPWISHYGTRIHVQNSQGLLVPAVQISLDGSTNPPIFTAPIPLAQNPALIAETVPKPNSTLVGIAESTLIVNQSNGHMCAALCPMNGPTTDYIPVQSIWTACSDNGLAWTNTLIYKNQNPDVSLFIFYPSPAIDVAGNLYFVISANMDASGNKIDGANIFVFTSTDGGLTWSAPKKVNSDGGTNIFPRAVARCNGGVDIAWYGTNIESNPQSMPSNAEWHVYMSQSKNATSLTPSWNQNDVSGTIVHYGPMNHKAAFNSNTDWRVIAMLGIDLDGVGKAHVVWQDTSSPFSVNPNANPLATYLGNPGFSFLYHSRQTSGSALDTCN